MGKTARVFAVLIGVCVLALPTIRDASATAQSSFSGTCALNGVTTFSAPVGFIPPVRGHQFVGDGTCTGVLNGRSITLEPVHDIVTVPFGINSCEANVSLNGPGVLTFADGSTLRFGQTTTGVGNIVPIVVTGAQSGAAYGILNFPVDLATMQRCAGQALNPATLTVTLATITPLVG